MVNTSHMLLPLLMPNQAQKEIVINEALITIDAILNRGVKSIHLEFPPSNIENGDIYIIGNQPLKEWQFKNKHIAHYQDGWRFIEPKEGMQFWVNDKDELYIYDGREWISLVESIVKILKNKL